MDIPIQLPNTIYGWIAIIALIISGLLFVRRNDIKSLRDANDDLRKRLDDKEKETHDLQLQLNGFKVELGKLRGILEEKDKRIDSLSQIHIGLSPEMSTYMSDMRNFTTQVHQYMVDSTKVLTEINIRKEA